MKTPFEYCGDRRGGFNVPWGAKITPIKIPKDVAALDAALRVIASNMGVEPIGKPALQLITDANGG